MPDTSTIKENSTIRTCGYLTTEITWVDIKDVADCAVTIMIELVEKHDRSVYEVGGNTLINEELAQIFTRILNKLNHFVRKSFEDTYDAMSNTGCLHRIAYDAIVQTQR